MITPSFGLTAAERVLPKLALDFTTASLDSRITFTRSGATATRVNSSGFIQAVAADVARFDFNPVTLVCRGLLIEDSKINYATYSNSFFHASWTPSSVTSGTSIASPDGTANAVKVIANASNALHFFSKNATGVPTTAYSFSIYAKKGELTKFALREGSATGAFAAFDVDAGTVLDGTGVIVDAGDGFYRCTLNMTLAGTTFGMRLYLLPNTYTSGSVTNIWTGDGASGLYWYGSQLEAGALTSYIPTEATTVARNADVATITGTNFSDFWQATRGGASVLATPSTVSGIRPLVQFDDNTANEIIALRGNTTNPELYIVDGGTPQAQLDAGTIAANTAYSLTGWWQENNSFAQLNTQASVRDNTVTIPTVTQARIGSDGTNYLNGTIAAIYYYDELANSIYDSLRLLGYTGTVTDMLLQYYLARGATSNSLTDAEIEFLGVKGFTTGTIDDRWTNYLISLGYSGTITDMKYQYWKSPE